MSVYSSFVMHVVCECHIIRSLVCGFDGKGMRCNRGSEEKKSVNKHFQQKHTKKVTYKSTFVWHYPKTVLKPRCWWCLQISFGCFRAYSTHCISHNLQPKSTKLYSKIHIFVLDQNIQLAKILKLFFKHLKSTKKLLKQQQNQLPSEYVL